MSTEPTGLLAAWRAVFAADLTANEKLVMFGVLHHWSHASQRPWPGVDRLSAVTSLHRATVMRAIATLRAKGALDVAKAHGRPNVYTLSAAFDGALPVAESDQSQRATSRRERLLPVAESDGYQSHTATTTSRTQRPEEIQRRDPEKRSREEIQSARGTHAPKPTGSRRSREAPIPADWSPTDSHRELATKYGLDLDLEAIAFVGYFQNKTVASPNGRFSTWLANSAQRATSNRGAKPGNARGPAPVSSREDFEKEAREGVTW